jgi:hypothetical protein
MHHAPSCRIRFKRTGNLRPSILSLTADLGVRLKKSQQASQLSGGFVMKSRGVGLAAVFAAACVCSWVSIAAVPNNAASEATIAARQRFFGAENVDPKNGKVRGDRVIFSWITNAGYAVSFRGRVVLLDTYINRFEVPPASGPDLRRTPFGAQDLIDLHPEAIFLGHGHGDHADNAAYIAKWLSIPIYSTPETCDVMQQDVARMAADPNTVNGGSKLVSNANPVNCIGVVPRGSVPGTAILNIKQLNPVACIVAFKHIHSGTVPTDPNFWGSNPVVPVVNDYDPREQALYPPGTCVAPYTPSTTREPAGTVAQIGPGSTGGVWVTE